MPELIKKLKKEKVLLDKLKTIPELLTVEMFESPELIT